jgi:hypothetical protein
MKEEAPASTDTATTQQQASKVIICTFILFYKQNIFDSIAHGRNTTK